MFAFHYIDEYKWDQVLLNKLIERMLSDTDPELASGMAMAQVMRSLLDPDSMISAPNSKCERHEFLTFFYRRSMQTLCKPIIDNTLGGTPKRDDEKKANPSDDYHTANKEAMIVDLLCFCFEHHAMHMRNYCINNKLLNKIVVLLQSKHHFLALSALRLVRRVVQLKDEFYFRYIVRDDVMGPVIECFRRNGHRYNLMNSAIIELFEFVRTEEIKMLITYVVEKYGEQFEDVSYVKTFTMLRIKYDQIKDRENAKLGDDSPTKSSPPPESQTSNAQWKKERQADADEQWFNDDDSENVAQDGWDETTGATKEPVRNGSPRTASNGSADGSPLEEDEAESPSNGAPKAFRSESATSPSSSAKSSPNIVGDEESSSSSASYSDDQSPPPHPSEPSFSPVVRKSGTEPNFPSVIKRKLVDEDSEEIFSQTSNPSRIRGTPRIVIKMNSDRARSPCRSPPPGSGSPPGDPVVSSTEVLITPSSSSPLERPSAPLPTPPITVKKALVDYDESDSDEEDESEENNSLPSSSSSAGAGRQVSNLSSQSSSSSGDDHDDVSSTSGDHEPSPGCLVEEGDDTEKDGDKKVRQCGDEKQNELDEVEKRSSTESSLDENNLCRKRAAECEMLIKDEPKALESGAEGTKVERHTDGTKRLRLDSGEEHGEKTENLVPTAGLVS
ncbi:unnamed protein product [Anisakis simplex]|uniref:SMK-1 domain-containing protein n=1 Tax=Anisakis simplex TaxID=6269 RepID=A0A0M3JVZ0_ANISI|nr:unnamed protein product [Anisakis simplex]